LLLRINGTETRAALKRGIVKTSSSSRFADQNISAARPLQRARTISKRQNEEQE
jgi:hypothetical protein